MKTWLFAGFAAALFAACGTEDRNNNNNPTGPTCGDGKVTFTEQCDDGNTKNGDGCSSTCKTEQTGGVCGDGNVTNAEGCDDGNDSNGDGCSASCAIENGYTCMGSPSSCVKGTGGGGGGGGGGGTCAAPVDVPLTDDNGILTGQQDGDTSSTGNDVAEADCGGWDAGAGHDQTWSFTTTDTRDVFVWVDDISSFDTVIRLTSTACDVTSALPDQFSQPGCSDFEGTGEYLVYVALPPGTYFVTVDGYTDVDQGAYSFGIEADPTGCGNGALDQNGVEACDDGNTADGDGCNSHCVVEDGFQCDASEPSVCTPDSSSAAVPPQAGDLVINEFMAADNASDTNCDGSTVGTADEFVELVNKTNNTLDLTGVTLSDSVYVRHTFEATTLAPHKSVVVWSYGSPACTNVDKWYVASTGQLGLNDTGDSIVVKSADATPVTIATTTFNAATANISANLSPDVTGSSYMAHNAMPNAAGGWSPGLKSDGTAF